MNPFAITDADRTLAASVARVRTERQYRGTGIYRVTVGGIVVGQVERFALATSKTAVWWAANDDNGVRVASGLPTRADAAEVLARSDDAVKAYRDAAVAGAFGTRECARVTAEREKAIAEADAQSDAARRNADRADHVIAARIAAKAAARGYRLDADKVADVVEAHPQLAAAAADTAVYCARCNADVPADEMSDLCPATGDAPGPHLPAELPPAPVLESMLGREAAFVELLATQDAAAAPMSSADVKAVAARLVPRLAGKLAEGDRFTLDGATWHVCAVNLSWGGSIAVYVDDQRDDDAPTVRVDAAPDAPVIVEVARA